jgi:hypothetical protein
MKGIKYLVFIISLALDVLLIQRAVEMFSSLPQRQDGAETDVAVVGI